MLNQVVLVGRITAKPEIIENESGAKSTIINIAVTRNFKNLEGIYETDFFPIKVWEGVAESVVSFCAKGDLVGIKGRIETSDNKIIIIAEKVTFLSTAKKESEEK